MIREHGGLNNEHREDTIIWTENEKGSYSTSSAYNAQFKNIPNNGMKSAIWKVWAPGKIKIFSWLIHHDKVWCNDRLQRRQWPNPYFCQFCLKNLESSVHLF